VKLFFALNNALMDAGIAAWECKRFYDYVRPITALRFLFAGPLVEAWGGPFKGTQSIDGANWLPYQPGTFLTPPFAEYPSGHSAFSASAAEILRRFTGSDLFFHAVVHEPGSSRIEPGATPARPVVLFWPTFSFAAHQGPVAATAASTSATATSRRVGSDAKSGKRSGENRGTSSIRGRDGQLASGGRRRPARSADGLRIGGCDTSAAPSAAHGRSAPGPT
jgi:hypothetical protein